MKFCLQLKTNDHDEDTWLQKESPTEAVDSRLETMNEMFHLIEMLVKATATKNMIIHMHMMEDSDE